MVAFTLLVLNLWGHEKKDIEEKTQSMTPVETLISYFESGAFPNSTQFKELIQSLWHKSERIPIAQIETLVDRLNVLLETETFNSTVQDIINDLSIKLEKGTYNGTADDLYHEIQSVLNGEGKTYLTVTEAMSVTPLPSDNTPFRIKNNPPTSADGNYVYLSTETNGYKYLGNSIQKIDNDKLNKVSSLNRLNPHTFRYGYFYYTGNSGAIQYNENNNYGCTDYIPVSEAGLITTGAGLSTQGLSSQIVFDNAKNRIRNVQDSNQYTFVEGDAFVVFVYRIAGDLNFAKKVGVIEGTNYEFEEFTEFKPLLELEKRVTQAEKVTVEKVSNGNPLIYGDVGNFIGGAIQEKNIESDYLTYFKANTGNTWILTPVFIPLGSNLVHIKFNVEFTRVGGHDKGLSIYVADQTSVGGNYTTIATVNEDGEYDITFDPAYYTVYEGYTQFYVWINNQNMASGQSLTAKLTNLRVLEYENAVQATNFSGENSKELFESADVALTSLRSQLSNGVQLISPNGSKYELGITNAGTITAIPIIPDTAAFFGNSLLQGFGGYGMAASATDKDYYHLITSYITTLNTNFTATRNSSGGFESLTSSAAIDGVIQSAFLDVLTGNENLVVIQLGDNVNTPEKNAIFAESSLKLCKAIRNKCPNARVIWMGMWYSTVERYQAIQDACARTGCKFISFSDLISNQTRNAIGNLTNKGLGTRTLENATNVVVNSANNITVTFTVGADTYNTTIDVASHSLSSSTLTYSSDYEIISSAGVASHPNDEGFRLIANRLLYEMKLTEVEEYYN